MIIKGFISLSILTVFVTAIFLVSCASDNGISNDASVQAEGETAQDLEYLGNEICMECHEDHLYDLPQSKHWQMEDARTPGAHEYGCELCHGPGSAHMEAEGEIDVPGLITFGNNANVSAAMRNQGCLSCHQSDTRHWQGSLHDIDDMSCASCHSMHRTDMAMSRLAAQDFCYACHQNVRSETYRPFRHPIREELLRCTDCHNPHGSPGPSMLNQLTLNDNCYSCHAEKRGPYLWEHDPVSEDCGICHAPHGSLHPALLTSRPPFLCQQCHQSTRITHARQGFYFGKVPPPHKGGVGPGQGEGPIGGDEPGSGKGPDDGRGGDDGHGGGTGPIGGNSLISQAGPGSGQGPGDGTGNGSGPGDGTGNGSGPGDGTGNGEGPGGGNGGGGDGGDQDQDREQDRDRDQGRDQDREQDQDRDRIRQGPGADRGAEGGSSRFLLGGSCTNCHSQVHGSNHPSGVKFLR